MTSTEPFEVLFAEISIHTSTREVTQFIHLIAPPDVFQSTLPQGKWHGICVQPGSWRRFQSTLPQGKWHTYNSLDGSSKDFNPHFHKGSDTGLFSMLLNCAVFQSTLPQGKWRTAFFVGGKGETISIHTSTREVTDPPSEAWGTTGISIHTSTREVTGRNKAMPNVRPLFQSTLPQGKWPSIRSNILSSS